MGRLRVGGDAPDGLRDPYCPALFQDINRTMRLGRNATDGLDGGIAPSRDPHFFTSMDAYRPRGTFREAPSGLRHRHRQLLKAVMLALSRVARALSR
jgi:hypothetical protein